MINCANPEDTVYEEVFEFQNLTPEAYAGILKKLEKYDSDWITKVEAYETTPESSW